MYCFILSSSGTSAKASLAHRKVQAAGPSPLQRHLERNGNCLGLGGSSQLARHQGGWLGMAQLPRTELVSHVLNPCVHVQEGPLVRVWRKKKMVSVSQCKLHVRQDMRVSKTCVQVSKT
jgi:hypothetical protein